MIATAPDSTATKRRRLPTIDAASVALTLLLIATTVIRFNISAFRPLWLDEVQTGMLVTQPTLGDFVRECGYDVNGPLYYILALIWSHISGISNHALRILPQIFGTAAPILALSAPKLIDRPTRFTWCGLLACWIPGIWYSQEARPYSLALMLAVANAVTFSQLLKSPTRSAAWFWAIASSLLVLAHYFGAVIIAFQAVVFLGTYKKRAFENWAAAFPFLIPIVSILIHAGQLARFASPGTGWIRPQRIGDLWQYLGFVFGAPLLFWIALIWAASLFGAWLLTKSAAAKAREEKVDYLWLAAGCSIASLGLVVALGFIRPVLIARYLTVFVPGIFLGLALFAGRILPQWRMLGVPLVTLFAALTIYWAEQSHFMDEPFTYEFASDWIMRAHPKRVEFVWDSPMRPRRTTLTGLGGFFFWRAGLPITVDGVQLADGDDPNKVLIERAADPGSAILWIYDLTVNGTAAIWHPPRLTKLDPALTCRDFGGRQFGIIACTHGRPKPVGFGEAPPSRPIPAPPGNNGVSVGGA